MIEVHSISKSYGGFKALDKVSFKVSPGQITAFLGVNGAGKTTALDIVCGCKGADQGRVKINGFDIQTNGLKAKESLGYLPDLPPLHHDMTVSKNLRYAARLRALSTAVSKEKTWAVMETVGIKTIAHKLISSLSKGYKQRVALAQTLIHDPKVLVLDEPTEGLDPNQISEFRQLILSLSKNRSILISSHLLSEVENLCQEVIFIDKGCVIKQGPLKKILGEEKTLKTYTVKTRRPLVGFQKIIRSFDKVTLIQDEDEKIQDMIKFQVHKDNEEDVVNEIILSLTKNGHSIKEIYCHNTKLENIFAQVTRREGIINEKNV